jgi:type IV pilus assembly protein PilV
MKKQSGVMLLEALIAIFIFSLGILAVVGMQAIAAKQVSDAQYRSQASLLANQLIGAMWTTDRTVATLYNTFDDRANNPTGYSNWKDDPKKGVLKMLPVPDDSPPSVRISDDGTATIVIQWLAPSESANATPHKYTIVAKIM